MTDSESTPEITVIKPRKKLRRLFPIIFSAVFLLGFIAYGVFLKLDEPRRAAEIASKVEMKGGQVVDLDWGDGYRVTGSNRGHVDVVFAGQQSRFSLTGLQHDPARFECDPALKR